MTIEELASALKTNVESIGLEIWDPIVFHKPYRSNHWLFTVEAPKTHSLAKLQKQRLQLLGILAELGIEKDMLTHFEAHVGRGKIWYAFYTGVKGQSMRKLLNTKALS